MSIENLNPYINLAEIHMPIAIVQSEQNEFIKLEHAEYLARSIPGAFQRNRRQGHPVVPIRLGRESGDRRALW